MYERVTRNQVDFFSKITNSVVPILNLLILQSERTHSPKEIQSEPSLLFLTWCLYRSISACHFSLHFWRQGAAGRASGPFHILFIPFLGGSGFSQPFQERDRGCVFFCAEHTVRGLVCGNFVFVRWVWYDLTDGDTSLSTAPVSDVNGLKHRSIGLEHTAVPFFGSAECDTCNK